MSLEVKKQRRGSNAPELLTNTVERLPPSHEWLTNLATFPILVASIFSLKHAFLDGRCSLTTKSAEEKRPPNASSSYFWCRLLASLVVKSSPIPENSNWTNFHIVVYRCCRFRHEIRTQIISRNQQCRSCYNNLGEKKMIMQLLNGCLCSWYRSVTRSKLKIPMLWKKQWKWKLCKHTCTDSSNSVEYWGVWCSMSNWVGGNKSIFKDKLDWLKFRFSNVKRI